MANPKSEIRNHQSSGFTLVEVMLALSLVTLVLAVVGIAINTYLGLLDSGRTEVEEGQLARALLRRIADDLRSAVQYDPSRNEKLMSGMMGLPSGAATAGGTAMAGGQMSAGAGGSDVEDFGTEDFDDTQTDYAGSLLDASAFPPVPGLYGNRYQLQVDTSRLPRLDQFNGMLSGDDALLTDRLSDVKTVCYYVIADQLGGGFGTSGVLQEGRGLVRRELDRATTAYAAESGQLAETQDNLGPLAPEVAGIEFLYFDGTEVVEEWDSEQRGGLPVAVEITLYIIPVERRNTETASVWAPGESALAESEPWLVYRLLVRLPAARPTTLEDTTQTSEESSEESESDSGGGRSG